MQIAQISSDWHRLCRPKYSGPRKQTRPFLGLWHAVSTLPRLRTLRRGDCVLGTMGHSLEDNLSINVWLGTCVKLNIDSDVKRKLPYVNVCILTNSLTLPCSRILLSLTIQSQYKSKLLMRRPNLLMKHDTTFHSCLETQRTKIPWTASDPTRSLSRLDLVKLRLDLHPTDEIVRCKVKCVRNYRTWLGWEQVVLWPK